MKWIAFIHGVLIPDNILETIIWQARRGLVTEKGKSLLLIPDRRKGRTDASGLQEIVSVKRKDCMTLAQFSRRFQKRPTKPSKSKKTVS